MKDGVEVLFVLASDLGSPSESFRIPIGTERLWVLGWRHVPCLSLKIESDPLPT